MRKMTKKVTSTLIGLLTLTLPLIPAFALSENSLSCSWEDNDFFMEVDAGYRQDSLNWNIAGPDGVPNVLSELKWSDLGVYQVGGKLIVETVLNLYLRAEADYGKIFQGKNRDSDYAENDRTLEFSRSINKSKKGEVFDLSAGVGYTLTCGRKNALSLSPLVGYSRHEQHLRMYDGDQVIDLIDPADVGPFPGLHSNYRARWKGPWVGMDMTYQVSCHFTLSGTAEYHWARYHGTGHWNLRTDFLKDFQQHANAKGQVYSVSGYYACSDACLFGTTIGYQVWKTGHGRSRTFDVEGTFDQPLNRVNWQSFKAMVLLVYLY